MAEVTGHTRATLAYIAARLPAMASLFILLVGIAWAGGQAVDLYDRWQTSRIEQADVFEYSSVEYIETTDDAIMMASTAGWFRHADRIEWLDRLDCGGGTWSSQIIERAEREPEPVSTVVWPYKSRWPTDGRECFMESVITVEHRGRLFVQRVQSAPFTPGEPHE